MDIKFDHVALRCVNVDAMKDFFVNVLEFHIGDRPMFNFHGYWLYIKDDKNATIHLIDKNDTPIKNNERTTIDHIAFKSDDYEKVMKNIKINNIEFAERKIPQRNTIQVFLQAPEKVIVEVDFDT